jgi:hypothetical protein
MKTLVELQEVALAEYRLRRASERVEIVAIGLEARDAWVQLPNIAASGTAFHVAGDDVRDAIAAIGCAASAKLISSGLTIWHSHYVNDMPSRADLDNFPQWARRGLLFHVPSERSIPYTRAGVLSSLVPSQELPSYESEEL